MGLSVIFTGGQIETTSTVDQPIHAARELILAELDSCEDGCYADDLAKRLNLPTGLVVEIIGQLLDEGILESSKLIEE